MQNSTGQTGDGTASAGTAPTAQTSAAALTSTTPTPPAAREAGAAPAQQHPAAATSAVAAAHAPAHVSATAGPAGPDPNVPQFIERSPQGNYIKVGSGIEGKRGRRTGRGGIEEVEDGPCNGKRRAFLGVQSNHRTRVLTHHPYFILLLVAAVPGGIGQGRLQDRVPWPGRQQWIPHRVERGGHR
jgi:hypothetical protein